MIKQAVILVGGRGTRLGKLTNDLPKPLIKVAGEPFLDHLINYLLSYNMFEHILLLAGYKGDVVRSWFEGTTWDDIRQAEVRFDVVIEDEPLGTAGAIINAQELLDERFLLLNGDSFFKIDIADFIATDAMGVFHMALRNNVPEDRYGRALLEGNTVIDFFKANAGYTGCPVNGGVYILDKAITRISQPMPLSLENDLLPHFARTGIVTGKVYDGYFVDIGVPEDLVRADKELLQYIK